jgi:hypothetical protein
VQQSLVYVEKRFGPESIEYGREAKKYADLLTKADPEKHKNEVLQLTHIFENILNF